MIYLIVSSYHLMFVFIPLFLMNYYLDIEALVYSGFFFLVARLFLRIWCLLPTTSYLLGSLLLVFWLIIRFRCYQPDSFIIKFPFSFFFKTFLFEISFRLTAKLKCRHRDFPRTLCSQLAWPSPIGGWVLFPPSNLPHESHNHWPYMDSSKLPQVHSLH